MAMPVEMTDEIPPPSQSGGATEDITLYGVELNEDKLKNALPGKPLAIRALVYGFCYQGHCYRLAQPAIYAFDGRAGGNAVGCGYDGIKGYRSWTIEKEDKVMRIERRKGNAGELILDFNLPGRSPATLTYSAKVLIASKAGKVYE